MAAPLIRTLQVQGGTLYAFTSASQDLTMAFGNDDLNFEFSKFALLDIPDIDVPNHNDNFIQWNTIDGQIFDGMGTDDNVNLAQSLQNYALNFEQLILMDDDYDGTLKRTVSERVFWKWMKELGAIRFQNASADDTSKTEKFKEENFVDSGQTRYRPVVQYIGDIEVTNNATFAGNTYSELYLNVPSHVGSQPTILFDSISDVNYYPEMYVTGASEYIYNRDDTTIHPDALSINAYYDYDALVNYGGAESSDGTENARWHESFGEDAYYTEPTFGLVTNDLIKKDHADYPTADSFTTIEYNRTKLDGISIDFNVDSYKDLADSDSMNTLFDYAQADNAESFQFNAVLIYYDLYNSSDRNDSVTNLYGILILDNVYESANKAYIQRYDKFKPDPVTKLNGNAYGLKVNIKFDTSVDNVALESNINDYNTMSMELFNDASLVMQNAYHIAQDLMTKHNTIQERLQVLEGLAFSSTNVNEMKSEISTLKQSVIDSNKMFENADSVLELIGQNSKDIADLSSGSISRALQWNTSAFEGSDGILVDKSVKGSLKFVNKNQAYAVNRAYDYEFDTNTKGLEITKDNPFSLLTCSIKGLYVKLDSFSNMIRINVEDPANSSINIYIDDYLTRFKRGQSVKFCWDSDINVNGQNINIFTDSSNRLNQGTYGKAIKSIPPTELTSSKPIIEIVCLNETSYEFSADVIR